MPRKFNFANHLYYNYSHYQEKSLRIRRFKHSDLVNLINKLKDNDIFTLNKAGESVEGRTVYMVSVGNGDKKVLLWSQMHGDEATATMAIFDIFNFFSANDDANEVRKDLLSKLTICFVPMLNPDGTERFQRRNAHNIDVNRDAVRLQTPEGKILKKMVDILKPDFGYNLHDQTTRYTVGKNPNSAAISLLAPTIDHEKSTNEIRTDAIKLAASFYQIVSKFIPGHVAKYSDDFEFRAFGDNVQKWGVRTILVESGGWKNDPEKQFLRKINFIGILSSLESIADNSFKKESKKTYDNIPFNQELLFDVLLRNLEVSLNGKNIIMDFGINHYEINCKGNKSFYYKSKLNDMGDLSTYFGYEDIDLKGYSIEPGKVYENHFNSIEEIKNLKFNELYRNGYTDVVLESEKKENDFTKLPINIRTKNDSSNKIEMDAPANFSIKKDNFVKYIIVNGFVCDVDDTNGNIPNGLIVGN
jgi:Zinc carboxypeptidase